MNVGLINTKKYSIQNDIKVILQSEKCDEIPKGKREKADI